MQEFWRVSDNDKVLETRSRVLPKQHYVSCTSGINPVTHEALPYPAGSSSSSSSSSKGSPRRYKSPTATPIKNVLARESDSRSGSAHRAQVSNQQGKPNIPKPLKFYY